MNLRGFQMAIFFLAYKSPKIVKVKYVNSVDVKLMQLTKNGIPYRIPAIDLSYPQN